MSKDTPIVVQELREFEGDPLGFYARGHHDPAAFLLAVAVFVEETNYPRRFEASTTHVRHEYWRNLPAPNGERGSIFVIARGPGRGAYPVTVIE